MPVRPPIIPVGYKKTHAIMYVLGFIFYLHAALPTYVNSTFLSQLISEKWVGLIYTAGYFLALIGFLTLPNLLRRYGEFKLTFTLAILQMIAILGLSYFKTALFLIPIFTLNLMFLRMIAYNIDIFLEHYSQNKETGGIRGAFLTITNLAYVISPLAAGFILGQNENYSRLYLVTAILVLPLLSLLAYKFRGYKDASYERIPLIKNLQKIWRNKDLRNVTASAMVLNFFYAWMGIYVPIYLHEHLGLSWEQIGIAFTIMLLPFILFEFPLGKVADTKLGEKEILTLGLIIMAVSSGTLAFITSTSVILWGLALFATRVGASMVEVMTETYFFKKINDEDSTTISAYRMTVPITYIVAPLIASVLLYVFNSFLALFIVLGMVCLYGIKHSLAIKDTL